MLMSYNTLIQKTYPNGIMNYNLTMDRDGWGVHRQVPLTWVFTRDFADWKLS